MSLMIDQIRLDGGTQSRAAINKETVAEYAEQMEDESTVFPPVIVYHDGKDYWLADGFHRVEAWKRIGRLEVPADVRQGDRRAAILHSCQANSAHGLRRSDEDKRRAVVTLLEDAEWSQWSDREIARRVRVSPTTVAKYRAELSVHGGQIATDRKVERGGTVYTQDTAKIGKPKEPAAPVVSEDASGRQEAGCDVPPPADSKPSSAADIPTGYVDEDSGSGGVGAAPAPDPVRKALAALTREAIEDEVIWLREEVGELRKRVKSQTSMIADLKARIKELEADDKNAVAARYQKKVDHLEREMFKAKEEARRNLAAKKRAEDRVAELEGKEFTL